MISYADLSIKCALISGYFTASFSSNFEKPKVPSAVIRLNMVYSSYGVTIFRVNNKVPYIYTTTSL